MSGSDRVVILGATNRPNDIDEAFLRRLPMKIKIDFPNEKQRLDILRRVLLTQSNFDP